MTPLRQQMLDAMLMHGFSEHTQTSYIASVSHLAKYYHQSPDTLTADQLKAYFLHLVKDKRLSSSSCHLQLCAFKFLYVTVLHVPWFESLNLILPKKPQRIPQLLSTVEVRHLLAACHNIKHHAVLSTCYACGLRVSELAGIECRHVDQHRKVIHIEQGKGRKDRLVLLGECLQQVLERYCARYQPKQILFFGAHRERPLSISTIQHIYKHAKSNACIEKYGSIHSLRHAYATHQLQAGVPIHHLQQLMGHKNIHTTLRYLHWSPQLPQGQGVDLLAGLAP